MTARCPREAPPAMINPKIISWGQINVTVPFETFCHLTAGMVAQTGRRTVTGMLMGAGLSRLWPHRRAHAFFSQASWDPGQLGLRLARAVVKALLPANVLIVVVIDDTLLHR